jgi:hypothetical protein
MEITRNQYYMGGIVLLLLGLQFRAIDRIDLTPEFTQFLAERSGHPLAAVNAGAQSLTQLDRPLAKKTVTPPDYLGWLLVSFGSVAVLHSLAMPKPPG